jgi:hypothetical protein
MLAVAFLGRDSAITKQAQMALAAPSVQACSVLLSINRIVAPAKQKQQLV